MVAARTFYTPEDFPGIRPGWLLASREQTARARQLIAPEFWQSKNPLASSAYESIGFPFAAGRMTAETMREIYQSPEYIRIDKTLLRDRAASLLNRFFSANIIRRHREEFSVPFYKEYAFESSASLDACIAKSSTPAYLKKAVRQMALCDYHSYRQENIVGIFSLDIARVHPHSSQRFGGYHTDGSLGDKSIAEMTEAFQRGGKCVLAEFPCPVSGIGRVYSAADNYPTDFKDHAPFAALDIIAFLAEEHASPTVPKKCTRFFLRAFMAPV